MWYLFQSQGALVERGENLPNSFAVFPNHPNPFNPSTRIRYEIPESGNVKVTIHNTLGQRVTTLVDEVVPAGKHEKEWHAVNNASSVYYLTVNWNNQVKSLRMLKMKRGGGV